MEDIDYQISYFNRYNQLHFRPDLIATSLSTGYRLMLRQSIINGIQEDTPIASATPYLRFGFSVSSERSLVTNISPYAGRSHNRQSDRS